MDTLWTQAGRFWWWAQQGSNSSIILVGITAWYAYLTHKIMKATARQAVAMLQPALSIARVINTHDDDSERLLIRNIGSHPVVILDMTICCFPMGKTAMSRHLEGWDDQVLPTDQEAELDYMFLEALKPFNISPHMCSYEVLITLSDLSRQVACQYLYLPVRKHLKCELGVPLRVRQRYMIRPWIRLYRKLKSYFL